jgi:hypothetical protein
MGLTSLFYPWGFILQAAAILHFLRRRPDTYWLWIILVGGGLGALVYIVAEAAPDVELLRGPFDALPRRRRIKELERIIIDNPAIGNREELADLYLEEGKFSRARAVRPGHLGAIGFTGSALPAGDRGAGAQRSTGSGPRPRGRSRE